MANRKKAIMTMVVLFTGLMFGGCAPSFTPELRRALVNGKVTALRSILQEHPELVNARDEGGRTPLHEAMAPFPGGRSASYIEPSEVEIDGEMKLHKVFRPQPESVKVLIEEGANVDARNKYGQTALHMAADYGQIELAELLVKNGANVNVRDRDGVTPLYYTMKLREPTDEHRDVAKLLIESGADIEKACKAGSGRLVYLAVSQRWPDVIEMLITKGANVNPKKAGPLGTPLHAASARGFREIAELLIRNGADTGAIGWEGETALHRAKTTDIAELLIANGTDVNAGSTEGMRPPNEAFAGILPTYFFVKGNYPSAPGNSV